MKNYTLEEFLLLKNYEQCFSITLGNYHTIIIYNCHSNCKLITCENVISITKNIDNFKLILKKLYTLTFFIHASDKKSVEVLCSDFKNIYIQEVPIGYHSNFQYHCLFLVENLSYPGYYGYLERINKYNEKEEELKEVI
jgi:hypothetical protein